MISDYRQEWARLGDFNGLGFLSWEYDSNCEAFERTYDASVEDGDWIGGCECPHCKYVGNHYTGAMVKGQPYWECGNCEHRSDV